MTFRSITRCLAVVLLLHAAVDLLYPVPHEDDLVASSGAVVCQGDHDADVTHHGGECFCCSRTVRTEGAVSLDHAVAATVVSVDAPVGLLDVLPPPPYHPPLV